MIIGASGYIGQNLYNYFSRKNDVTIGTYYKSPKKGLYYFDLEHPNLKNLRAYLKKTSHAFICSAITNIDECKRNEKRAYKINVEGTKKLIEQFFKLDIIPIFLSSDMVFDGEKGNYTELDKTNPCNIYGNHKKIIEDFLLNSNEPYLIARLSKIFGLGFNDNTLLTNWVKQLQNDEVIRCATNQILSPTYIKDLTNILDLVIEKKLYGLYNITSPESFSRFELAMILKSQLKIKSGKIMPCSIRDFNFLDVRPFNISLNTEKLIKDANFKFSQMKNCISKLEKLVK